MAITFVGSSSNGSTGAAYTVTVPSHNVHDFAFMMVFIGDDDGETLSLSSGSTGWNYFRRHDTTGTAQGGKDNVTSRAYFKFLTSNETNPEITITSGQPSSTTIHVFRGVDITTPFDLAPTWNGGEDVANPTNSAITTTTANCALLLYHMDSDPNITSVGLPSTPSSLTQGASYGLTSIEQGQICAYKLDVGAAGTTTPTAWTHTNNASGGYNMWTVALRPEQNPNDPVAIFLSTYADELMPESGFTPQNTGEKAWKTLLNDNGYRTLLCSTISDYGVNTTVTNEGDVVFVGGDANGSDLTNIVATTNGVVITGRTQADDMNLVSANGNFLSGTQINVVGSGDLADGNSGTTTVATAAMNIDYYDSAVVTFGSGVTHIAEIVGTSTQKVIFAYESGATMSTGTAAARRVFMGLNVNANENATSDSMVIAALDWARNAATTGDTIYVGSNAYTKVYIGSTQINRIYIGSTLTYDNT